MSSYVVKGLNILVVLSHTKRCDVAAVGEANRVLVLQVLQRVGDAPERRGSGAERHDAAVRQRLSRARAADGGGGALHGHGVRGGESLSSVLSSPEGTDLSRLD